MANFGKLHKSQAGTEYLVILGAVMLLGGIVVALLASSSTTSGVSDSDSESYWETTTPFAIRNFKVVNDSLIITLAYLGSIPAKITGLSVDGIKVDWSEYRSYAGRDYYYGDSLCQSGACDILFNAGKELKMISEGGFIESCKTDDQKYTLNKVTISYSENGISGKVFVGMKPFEGTCALVDPASKVYGCANLTQPAKYVLMYSINPALVPNGTCFNATSNGYLILDCKGVSITGNNTEDGFAFWSNKSNIKVNRCIFSNFSTAILMGGNTSKVTNSTIVVPANITPNDEKWHAIYLSGGWFANISQNFISSPDSNGFSAGQAPFFPSAVYLERTNNATIYANNISAGGYSSYAIHDFWGRNTRISSNNVTAQGRSSAAVYLNGTNLVGVNMNNLSAWNVSSNALRTNFSTNNDIRLNTIRTYSANSSAILMNWSWGSSLTSNNIMTYASYSSAVDIAPGSYSVTLSSNNATTNGLGSHAYFLRDRADYATSNIGTTYGDSSFGFYLIGSNATRVQSSTVRTYGQQSPGIWVEFSPGCTIYSNNVRTATPFSEAVDVVRGSQSTSFQTNTFTADNSIPVRIGWYSNPQAWSNNSATLYRDTLSCTSCPFLAVVNQSSSCVFSYMAINRSRITMGDDITYWPNNVSAMWTVTVNLRNLSSTGPFLPNYWINVSNATSPSYYQGILTNSGGNSAFTVTEFINITNSSGNFISNYTPHNFTAFDRNWTYVNSTSAIVTGTITLYLVNSSS